MYSPLIYFQLGLTDVLTINLLSAWSNRCIHH